MKKIIFSAVLILAVAFVFFERAKAPENPKNNNGKNGVNSGVFENPKNNQNNIIGSNGLIFMDDFSKNLDNWIFEEQSVDRIKIIEDPLSSTNKVLSVNLHPDDVAAKGNRAEIKFKDKNFEFSNLYGKGPVWYSWKFFIPTDYKDSDLKTLQIMGQWHQYPPTGEGFDWLENKYGKTIAPSVSIHYGASGGLSAVNLALVGDPLKKANNSNPIYFKKGKWNEVKIHINWSLGSDGFVEGFLNGDAFTFGGGEKHVSGANYLTDRGNYFKLGLYRGHTNIPNTTNTVLFDDVKIWRE